MNAFYLLTILEINMILVYAYLKQGAKIVDIMIIKIFLN